MLSLHAFIKGREGDREFGVIKINSNWLERLKAAVETPDLLRSLHRLEEVDRALKNAEEEYHKNVFTTGCKTRSWHKTALSHIEEAQKFALSVQISPLT